MKRGLHNLYIDESGSGAIYEPPPKNYQFFNMAGVIVSDPNEDKLSADMRKWRSEYLVNPTSNFHAVDFFEDFKENYRKKKLSTDISKYYKAVNELITIFTSITFEAKIFYIDLFKLREELDFDKFINGNKRILKDVINRDYQGRYLQPFHTILEEFFKFHESFISKERKSGYLCFESQKEFDERTIKTFRSTLIEHRKSSKIYEYGKTLSGIHFDTKGSLCGSLEMADFIAYGATQLLRSNANSSELTIDKKRLNVLLQAYKSLKTQHKITLTTCTNQCKLDYLNVYTPQQFKIKDDRLKILVDAFKEVQAKQNITQPEFAYLNKTLLPNIFKLQKKASK